MTCRCAPTVDRTTQTPEGFLLVRDVRIARTGTQLYNPSEVPVEPRPGGGPIQISRDSAALFDPAFLDSLVGKPITLGHPPDFVGIGNHASASVGTLLAARPSSGGFVVADFILTDSAAISAVRRGVRELSVGYDAEYTTDAPGVGRQSVLRANHLAIVMQGRCGGECCIDSKPHQPEEPAMSTFKEKLFAALGRAIDEADVDPAPAAPVEASGLGGTVVTTSPSLTYLTTGIATASADTATAPTTDADPMALMCAKLDAILALLGGMAAQETAEAATEGDGMMYDAEPELTDPPEPDVVIDAAPAVVDHITTDQMQPDADTISRAEILAPGIAKEPGVKAAALAVCYATSDGRKVIDSILDGEDIASADTDTLFLIASTLVKQARRDSISRASRVAFDQLPTLQAGPMTPQALNEKNAAFWAAQRN